MQHAYAMIILCMQAMSYATCHVPRSEGLPSHCLSHISIEPASQIGAVAGSVDYTLEQFGCVTV